MRCHRSRRCTATNVCVAPQPALPAPPGKRYYRCPKGKRQCPNRTCYPSGLFAKGPAGEAARTARAATTIAALFRGRRVAKHSQKARAATTIAARFRGSRVQKHSQKARAATTIAARFRGSRVQKHSQKARAATKIAALFRGTRVRSKKRPVVKIALGAEVAVDGYDRLTAQETRAALDHIHAEVMARRLCAARELSLREIHAHFANLGTARAISYGLKPYSILIHVQGESGFGFALVHKVQKVVVQGRRQRFEFKPTGLAVDLICANKGVGSLVLDTVHAMGRKLFGDEFTGTYLESIGGARGFYLKNGFVAVDNRLQSLKDNNPDHVDRDYYNMHRV